MDVDRFSNASFSYFSKEVITVYINYIILLYEIWMMKNTILEFIGTPALNVYFLFVGGYNQGWVISPGDVMGLTSGFMAARTASTGSRPPRQHRQHFHISDDVSWQDRRSTPRNSTYIPRLFYNQIYIVAMYERYVLFKK